MSSPDGWDLVKTARDSGRLLATGYQARYVPGHRAMLRLIEEGAIGDVSVAQTYYGINWLGPPPEWRRSRDLPTGEHSPTSARITSTSCACC